MGALMNLQIGTVADGSAVGIVCLPVTEPLTVSSLISPCL